MKVSLNWLRDYIDFDGTPAALAELLTFAGVEVENVETRGVNLDKVVVAQILASEQHPNADRLSVCRVDDGSGQPTPRQIVCGAKNYRVGDKVPLALPGAVLPGDFKIKVGKLRGVESEGMLCSAKELGVAEDAAGLLILPAEARVGAPIGELFPADTIFDLEITPNRPDLLSQAGLAREIAALTGRKCLWPGDAVWRALPRVKPHVEEISTAIAPDALGACPFYSARVIVGVQVKPSPKWLRARLESVGLRSINNVVDVTNYVMLEMGQPLHAFDAEKLHPGLDPGMGTALQTGIEVRLARAGEELRALDGKSYRLAPHHLVIAERDGRALALAGVMGGEESGVTETTRTVILESAYFTPSGIRRTSRELGLASDSSYRFERGVDLGQTDDASLRATQLILKVAGGEGRGMYIAQGTAQTPLFSLDGRAVALRPERARRLLGVELSDARQDEILRRFGLSRAGMDSPWQVPSYRQDLLREVDLIEELARVIGLDAVPSSRRTVASDTSPTDREFDFTMRLRRRLVGLGFAEARTPTLIAGRAAEQDHFFSPAAGPGLAKLKNPLSEEQTTLRPSLVPGLLTVAAHNARVSAADVRVFELGRVFAADGRGTATADGTPEPSRLALLMFGASAPRSWRDSPRAVDLADLRVAVESLVPPGAAVEFRRAVNDRLALAVEVSAGGRVLGHAGQVRPARAKELDVRAPLLIAELDVAALRALEPAEATAHFQPLPRFPSVTRDLAVIVPDATEHGQLAETLRTAREPLLSAVDLFDVFTDPTGQRVPAGRKSLAYSLTYRAEDRTLTAEEVNAAHGRLKERLRGAFDLQFRE